MLTKEEKSQTASKIRALLPLLRELNDLKRLYSGNLGSSSLATQVFRGACQPLLNGASLDALGWSTALLAAARLGAISPESLADAGLSEAEVESVFDKSLSAHADLSPALRRDFGQSVGNLDGRLENNAKFPEDNWAQRLCQAPRAGATCPGKPRIVLEPPELHSDHCVIVAVYAFILAEVFEADREDAWLIGLCHHFHNAYLPDSGFTGEVLLGDQLDRVIRNFRKKALSSVHEIYRDRIEQLLAEIADDASPLAKTFHAADTIDRVVQMEHYERAGRFRVKHALHDLELVHEGPTQAFQKNLLRSIGLFPDFD